VTGGAQAQARIPAPIAGLRTLEDGFVIFLLAMMSLLPLIDAVLRKLLGTSVPGGVSLVRHGTLWITFAGAALAAREGKHLGFAAEIADRLGRVGRIAARALAGGLAVAVVLALTYAAFLLIGTEQESEGNIGGYLPIWVALLAVPASLLLLAGRLLWQHGDAWRDRLLVAAVAIVVLALALIPPGSREFLFWPSLLVLLAAAVAGAPIFSVLGGLALMLFFISAEPDADIAPIVAMPSAAYEVVTDPFLPAIPLFTLAGTVLAAGGTSERLVGLFRALFGWLPGGVAVAAALSFAFFTTFTGASGVTILALGGLMMPMLLQERYPEGFSLGLLTYSGSLGLLFPPCLPVILVAVTARTPIDKMYLAGLIPGVLMIVLVGGYSLIVTARCKVAHRPLEWAAVKREIWRAKWEILLPLLVLVGIFGGLTTLVEAAAATVLYSVLIQTVLNKDLTLKTLAAAVKKGAVLSGGILIIVGVAKGLTDYLVDADVVLDLVDWVTETIESRYTFLLMLNVLLLAVGCLMDIISATIVVLPLILPMAEAYGIPPLHLGIVFLVNLELGFSTPPVGMNLFMSSYAFDRPLIQVGRAALPFLGLGVVRLLLVTFLPVLALWLTTL